MRVHVNPASPFARKVRIVARETGLIDFRFPEMDWRAAHPGLKRWFEKVSARKSIRDTLPNA